ncbi:GatB/YqeY domain-containing protein [Anaerotalea alkaliphila]|uniref:GatB/YqeY domain-containing protein n=1 Tax=Anaerotalea alkaliphila TaxID=2662126 RepID=A0A7X5HX82_9FIRM|nr:GatB/YqeY domain-containing protein [Anaerotalea alkaliphila]NDL68156.1 GatB/YqeY domain-containing protein [Anaerotalea alkaliphila]
MLLKEKLFHDLKEAMKTKETLKKNTIQSVRTAVLQFEKDNQVELADDEVLGIIAGQVKKRKAALPDFEKSGRQELVEELNQEIAILEQYLPEQLSEEALVGLIQSVIDEVGATSMKDMGKVMSALTSKLQGRADNRIASQLVKKLLA